MNSVAAIVLAAGEGTRFKATVSLNKVAYPLGDRPMVCHTVEHLHSSGVHNVVVVVGFAAASVRKALGDSVTYAIQRQRLGTGHAVKVGLVKVSPAATTILTMYGDDSAFYPPELFSSLLSQHLHSQAAISLITIKVDQPFSLGRIIRNHTGQIEAIVEEKNATKDQKSIKEINTGLFCFDRQFLETTLPKIQKDPVKQEYLLTDLVGLAIKLGFKVNAVCWPDSSIWHGVNTREELIEATKQASHLKLSVT
jgi:bifunctional UDP-N-acetylglucosamine pyrophosphorylase / glucosamine-1-phosphate N-acetyltransferase